MFDATAFLPEPGVFQGNYIWEGRSAECEVIEERTVNPDVTPIKGMHCLAYWIVSRYYTMLYMYMQINQRTKVK